MKKRCWMAIGVLFSLFLLSCNSAKEQNVQPLEPKSVSQNSRDDSYSHNTLILALSPDCTDSELEALLTAYNMSLLYRYTSFSMCAVTLLHSYTDDELSALIADLETNDCVLQAQRDYIMHLD